MKYNRLDGEFDLHLLTDATGLLVVKMADRPFKLIRSREADI